MDTHSMIFVTIDKLVSPSSSVDGDPLDHFPDHWQPHFSAGASGRPLQTKDLSGLGFQRKPGRHQSRLTRIGYLTLFVK
jgi:hypothetical protein